MMKTLRFLCSLIMLAPVFPAATALAAGKAVVAPALPATPSDPADGQQALDVLKLLLAAYAEGQHQRAEDMLEPQMIGHALISDALRSATLSQKQLRIHLVDTRVLTSQDVVIIRTRWEKRFLLLPALKAQLRTGSGTFVMHREGGVWRLSALSGDNLFAAD